MAIDSSYDYEDDQELSFKLLEALLSKDKVSFEEVVKKASPFQLDKRYSELNHRTLLHKVAEDPELENFATLLIDYGADVNYDDFRQFKPIHYSSEFGNLKVLQVLLSKKADVNAQNTFGDAPLHILARNKSTECIAALLKDDRVNLNLVNKEGYTCLDVAKLDGNEDICNMIRDRGKGKAILKRPNNEKMLLSSPGKAPPVQQRNYKILPIFVVLFFVSVITAFAIRLAL